MEGQSSRSHKVITDQMAENITKVEELAYELRVSEVMTRDTKAISMHISMRDVVELFRLERISGAPVVDGEQICGVVSMEDIIRCLLANDIDAPASKYMTKNPITVHMNDPVVEALKHFVTSTVGRLIVVDDQNHLQGIITKGDINRGYLRALQRQNEEEELRRYRARHLFEDIESDRTSLILRYNILAGDFRHGGAASSNIKRALLRLGASPQIARRVGIAVYEAEMNLVIHTTHGGIIRVEIEPHRMDIRVFDDGPGIEDVKRALTPGYSTATEQIRELGFGAGMGLTNIQRCVDEMMLESSPGNGTRLKMKINLDQDAPQEKKENLQNESAEDD